MTPSPAAGGSPAAPPAGETPYGMQPGYSWPVRRLLDWLFGDIGYATPTAAKVADLAQVGTVVYVARGHSIWLTLCFNTVLRRVGLPLATAVGGVHFAWLQPLGRLWRAFRRRHQPVAGPWDAHVRRPLSRREALFAAAALRGEACYVAMPIPREGRARSDDLNDYLRALIAAQRAGTRPIYLLPHALIDRGQSGGTSRSVIDRIFGDPRRPGALRHLAMLLTLRHGSLRMADPVDLQTFLAAHPRVDDVVLARKLRHELHHRTNEEERVVAGPRLSAYQTTARHVLRDPLVRAAIAEASATRGVGDLVLEAEAADALRGIAARYDVGTVRVLGRLLQVVFNRIYDGIAVDEAGLARVLEAARRGPLIFCPSHRSHIDYLVLSSVLWAHRIAPPHIAAGANLAFFPLGNIFRRAGAFFLRRTFRDDPLYAAVLRAYLLELLREGTSLEFFLEGGRSRTGKLLMPKFGLLGMCVDAWRRGARDDLQFVPLSIDYERIIEAKSYQHELGGGEKRAEDLSGLLRAPAVLRSRYGRVQMQFGEPISLSDLARSRHLAQSADPALDGPWREEIQRLGYRILHSVAMVCSVTPTAVVATALLSHPGRGMARGVLLARANRIVALLEGAAARISTPLRVPATQVSAVLEAVQKLVDDRAVVADRAGRGDTEPIYRVPDESRVELDYHKNALMNHFAPAALMARAVQRRPDAERTVGTLRADVHFLARLFKREFIFRADVTRDASFEATLADLIAQGILVRGTGDRRSADAAADAAAGPAPAAAAGEQASLSEGDAVTVCDPEAIAQLAALIDSFVQAYWITARTLLDLRAMPMGDRECVNRVLERCRRAFLEGDITRPEAANRSLVEAAVAWACDAGIVAAVVQGRRRVMKLGDDAPAEKLQQLIDAVAAYR